MAVREGPVTIRRLVVSRLGKWATPWDELVMQAAVPSPFLRSWWLNAMASDKTEFILVLEDGNLVGGLALERRHWLGVPVYRFAGSGALCPDHLDLLAKRGRESIVQRAIDEWFTRPGSRVLDLDGLVENSLLEPTFANAGTTTTDVAPWDELPASASEYIATLSSNLRKTLRQTQRRFSAAGVSHRRMPCRNSGHEDDAAAAALHEFTRLQELRGGRRALLRETPRLIPALLAGLDRGEVQIDVLEAADRVILVLISFQLGRAVRLYQSARLLDHEWRDALAVALLEVVRQACEDGCRELDLLRGGESYKPRFVRRKRAIRHLRAAHGLLGAVVLAALEALKRLRSIAGRVRRRVRTQRGLGRAGRNRWRAAE